MPLPGQISVAINRMENGSVTIPVRRALLYYALKRLGLDTDPSARMPQDQQIVLINTKAIRGVTL